MPREQEAIKSDTDAKEAVSTTKRLKPINLVEKTEPPLSAVEQRLAESAQKLGLTPEESKIFAKGRR